jgi:hypothetical protein
MTTGMLPSGTMAARSVISKPKFERVAGVTVCVEELARMVWPSGSAFATALMPMVFPAPGRFSTMMGCASRADT